MNPELIAILSRRLTRPAAASQLVDLNKAIRAKSPIVAQRYERVLQCSGALENPATTPEEREALLGALVTEPGTRSKVVRLRVTPDEYEALNASAESAGQSLSAYIRARCDLSVDE